MFGVHLTLRENCWTNFDSFLSGRLVFFCTFLTNQTIPYDKNIVTILNILTIRVPQNAKPKKRCHVKKMLAVYLRTEI